MGIDTTRKRKGHPNLQFLLLPDGTEHPVLSDANGNLLTALSNVEGTAGQAAPTKALLMAGKDSTNLRVPYVATIPDAASDLDSLHVAARLQALNASNQWDRLRVDAQKNLKVTDQSGMTVAPDVAAKTVTATAAELFAGAARKSGRYLMTVYNESAVPVYWGGASSVTTATGFTLPAGDTVTFRFQPAAATPIYFVSASSATVRVVEMA